MALPIVLSIRGDMSWFAVNAWQSQVAAGKSYYAIPVYHVPLPAGEMSHYFCSPKKGIKFTSLIEHPSDASKSLASDLCCVL